MSGKRRALVIANSNYDTTALRRLTAPVHDARELAAVLKNPAIGAFDVQTLLDETSAVISQAIEDFFIFSGPMPDDFLLLYFSGHGITDDQGQLFFATRDTSLVRQSIRSATAVGAAFVNAMMDKSRSRRQTLVLDCCHSGAFAETMRVKGEALPAMGNYFQGKGRIVLTASTAMQFSLEGAVEGEPKPSVYTRLLVKGLATGEADRDADGHIDLDELHDYLVDQVRAEAPEQTPTKSGYLEGRLYIARAAVAQPAKLPLNLQNALTAGEVFTRHGAVYALKELLCGEHPGLALAAEQALTTLSNKDDSVRVRSAAQEVLASYVKTATGATKTPNKEKDLQRAEAAKAAALRAQERKRLEQENLAKQKAEADRKAAEAERKAEADRKAAAKADRKAAAKAEAVRKSLAQQLEEERRQKLRQEKAEAERLAAQRAEAEERDKVAWERALREKPEPIGSPKSAEADVKTTQSGRAELPSREPETDARRIAPSPPPFQPPSPRTDSPPRRAFVAAKVILQIGFFVSLVGLGYFPPVQRLLTGNRQPNPIPTGPLKFDLPPNKFLYPAKQIKELPKNAVLEATVPFPKNQSDINIAQEIFFQRAADHLKEDPNGMIVVCAPSESESNPTISSSRKKYALSILREKGVPDSQLRSGPDDPQAGSFLKLYWVPSR